MTASAAVDRLGVLSSTLLVVEQAEHVGIDAGRLEVLCTDIAGSGGIEAPAWNRQWHWSGEPEQTAMYVMVLDSLNFCFWGEPRWRVAYGGQVLDGYWALAGSLKRAIEEGIPILDASYLANVEDSDLAHILRGTSMIPLLVERLAIVRELGRVLSTRYDGRCARFIGAANGDAIGLVHKVAAELTSFNDVARYQGHVIRFYKRAQILIGDLAGSLDQAGLGHFDNLHELTAFADYKLPQILRRLGVLTYDERLAAKVDAQERLLPGSAEEVEIRASTIWAVELIRQAMARLGQSYAPYQIDWWLWDASQRLTGDVRPYHRTRTTFY